MRLLLIRHGQSANNVLAESDGHDYDLYMSTRSPEPPLTELGKQQAELLAQQLAEGTARQTSPSVRQAWVTREYPIDELYVSPMLRALQTAAPIGRKLGLQPRVWRDIHEHGGVFTGNPEKGNVVSYAGLNREEMAAQFPTYVLSDDIGAAGWWEGGYEELDVCYRRAQRVAAALYAMAATEPDRAVALVTHGTFLDNLFHALFTPGECYDDRVHFSHLNTSVSRVDFGENCRVALRYLNRVDHLPMEVITR